MKNQTMSAKEWALLFVLSLLWGGSFTFNEIILRELQIFTMVFSRTLFASAILIILVYATGRKMPNSPSVWASFAMMGILNNSIPFTLIVWGQQHIESGLAAILNATTPLFSVVLAHFLTSEERFTLNRFIGVIFGLVGVAILVGPDALMGFGSLAVAQIAILGASCSYAFAGIFGRRFKGLEPIIPAAGMLTCTAIFMIPLVMLVDKPQDIGFAVPTWGAMLGQAVLSTAAAYLIYFRILKSAGATNALLVTILIPPSAMLLGWIILGEQLTWSLVAGMAVIFLGLMLVDGRFLKLFSRPSLWKMDERP